MRFTEIIRRRPIIFSVLFLAIIIAVLLVSIFILSLRESPKQNHEGTLLGYADLKQKIINIASKGSGPNNTAYDRLTKHLVVLENENSSSKEKYDALVTVFHFLGSEYSRTNNNEFYLLINEDLNNFAKDNFSQFYEENFFKTPCQDKSCAETEQPRELNAIIIEIEKSDFPKDVKGSLISDLTNTGYRSRTDSLGKTTFYLILADMTDNNDWFSDTGANKKIAQMIKKMVKDNFPDEFSELNKEKDIPVLKDVLPESSQRIEKQEAEKRKNDAQ